MVIRKSGGRVNIKEVVSCISLHAMDISQYVRFLMNWLPIEEFLFPIIYRRIGYKGIKTVVEFIMNYFICDFRPLQTANDTYTIVYNCILLE